MKLRWSPTTKEKYKKFRHTLAQREMVCLRRIISWRCVLVAPLLVMDKSVDGFASWGRPFLPFIYTCFIINKIFQTRVCTKATWILNCACIWPSCEKQLLYISFSITWEKGVCVTITWVHIILWLLNTYPKKFRLVVSACEKWRKVSGMFVWVSNFNKVGCICPMLREVSMEPTFVLPIFI